MWEQTCITLICEKKSFSLPFDINTDANVGDEKTLSDLGVGPNGTVQLDMQSADPINTPIRAFKPRLEYVMPDVITVRVETGMSH